MLSKSETADIIACAHRMADAARVETLAHFRTGVAAENKEAGGFDPVTIADRNAEEAMRRVLAEERPDDAILGEEFGSKPGTTGLTWVLDPIDGTRGFISGTPTWGVLIALSDDSGPIYGIVDQPYIGERFEGGFGQSQVTSAHGVRALKTSAVTDLAEATLFTTFPEVGSDAERQGFQAVAEQVKLVRYGMDCYAYALVATGQVDLVIEAGLNAYDVQGPIAVVEAAGGIVTDLSGGPAHAGGRALAAANAGIHAKALEVLRPFV
jgi:histidinol phosphatase-like enzyme (inositol monophosphatase family)